jgi:hypothetical protein
MPDGEYKLLVAKFQRLRMFSAKSEVTLRAVLNLLRKHGVTDTDLVDEERHVRRSHHEDDQALWLAGIDPEKPRESDHEMSVVPEWKKVFNRLRESEKNGSTTEVLRMSGRR